MVKQRNWYQKKSLQAWWTGQSGRTFTSSICILMEVRRFATLARNHKTSNSFKIDRLGEGISVFIYRFLHSTFRPNSSESACLFRLHKSYQTQRSLFLFILLSLIRSRVSLEILHEGLNVKQRQVNCQLGSLTPWSSNQNYLQHNSSVGKKKLALKQFKREPWSSLASIHRLIL